jgi:hypothetical protein
MIDGQPEPGPDRVRFAGTADLECLLADAPDVRTALLEEGVPTTAFCVVADTQLTILHSHGHRYIGSRPPGTATAAERQRNTSSCGVLRTRSHSEYGHSPS